MGIFGAVKGGFTRSVKLVNVILVFFAFNLIVGLVSLPLATPAAGAVNPGIMVISIIASLLFFFIFIFLQGGALGLVKDQIKTGASSMANFVDYGKKFYARILGLLFLYLAIAIGVVLVLSLVSAGVLLLGDNVVTRSLLAAIVTIAALAIVTLLIYPIYIVVAEDSGVMNAFKKGISVSRMNFLTTLGLFITLLIISVVISVIAGLIIGLVSVPLPAAVGRVLITVINAVVQSYIPVIMMIAFMSFYMGLSQPASQE